jgi:hypothetical protein
VTQFPIELRTETWKAGGISQRPSSHNTFVCWVSRSWYRRGGRLQCVRECERATTRVDFRCATRMNASEAAAEAAEATEAVTNLTLKAFIESQLGVQTLPLPVVVPLTVLFVLISITGVIGNSMVCMVIARHPGMNTATNYYLFSLALSDITILVFGEYKNLLCNFESHRAKRIITLFVSKAR